VLVFGSIGASLARGANDKSKERPLSFGAEREKNGDLQLEAARRKPLQFVEPISLKKMAEARNLHYHLSRGGTRKSLIARRR